jgi:hypothetical protein
MILAMKRIEDVFDKDKTIEAIKDSETNREVIYKLDSRLINLNGEKLLKDFIERYHIDISHYVPEGKIRCNSCGKIKPKKKFDFINKRYTKICIKCRKQRKENYVNGIYIGGIL